MKSNQECGQGRGRELSQCLGGYAMKSSLPRGHRYRDGSWMLLASRRIIFLYEVGRNSI